MENQISQKAFKIWVLGYVSFMTVFRLFEVFYFPEFIIISDRVILGTLVVSMGYLWIGEIRDRQFLLQANQKLMGMQDQLKQANFDTVSALINVIEAKDPYTRGHSDRVGEYSLLIANKIGLSQKDIEILNIPITTLASEAGDHRIGNMVALGALLGKRKIVALESLISGLKDIVSSIYHNLLPVNEKAIRKGFEHGSR